MSKIKTKKVKSKLYVELEYEQTLFTEELYKVNEEIDNILEEYFSKKYASKLQFGKETISGIKYVANTSHQTRTLLKTKLAKETINMLKDNTRRCLGVMLEHEMTLYNYALYLKSLDLEPVENVTSDIDFHLGILDICNKEYKEAVGDDKDTQNYLERTLKDVPVAYFDGESYLPSVEVFKQISYGVLIYKLQEKAMLPYSKCVSISEEIMEAFSKVFTESISDGYIEISNTFELGDLHNEQYDGEYELFKNLVLENDVTNVSLEIPVYELEGKKVISLVSLIQLLSYLNTGHKKVYTNK